MDNRIEQIQAFLKESPEDCFLNHALALEYVKLGNDEDARGLFEKNVVTDPGYIATYYHLGKLLERIGEQQLAMTVYERGMEQAKKARDMHTYNELQAAHDDLL
ncbi:MAG TPA: hypothetical protein VN721_01420 [Flavipsychrobacter sp.]|nr:hypothetical protein [Flavipsychrobacter sp.]